MTKEEAGRIPELDIHPDSLIEDCFYFKMAVKNKLSEEQGEAAADRMAHKYDEPTLIVALDIADQMIRNLEKYGVACIDWCD